MSARVYARVFVTLLIGSVMLTATAQAQTMWYVDDDAPNDPGPGDPLVSDPNEDGSAQHPFDAIQEGIDAAVDGDTVLVLDGMYTGWLNKNLTFDGLAITVRSANGPEACIIDCNDWGRAFLFDSDEGPHSVVDGFTVAHGWVEYPQSPEDGGAILCLPSASPTIMNCLLTDNVALRMGGAIWMEGSPTIIGCTITGNHAFYHGGGICCSSQSRGRGPHVIDCVICDNWTSSWGGGIWWGGVATDALISNCIIRDNWAHNGGGGIDCAAELTIVNCCLTGNVAGAPGGAGLFCSFYSDVDVINCTIAYNNSHSGFRGSGFVCSASDDLVITNTIFWNNYPCEGWLIDGAQATIRYTNRGCNGFRGSEYIWGPGNIEADPLFVDSNSNDYHLVSGSPCIDAGCNWLVPPDSADLDGDCDTDETTPLDLDGEGRFFDDPNMLDSGCGYPPIVDMGAYEFGGTGPQPCLGDLDGDRDVDLSDLAGLLANYGQADVCEGDLDCDGDVDLADLSALLAVYGTTCD